eukprot:s996_g23.t2
MVRWHQRQMQPMEQVSEASQTPDMPSPKDFVNLVFGLLAFILAISIHWFNEERSAKIEVLLTKGLEDCRSVDANHLNTENRGRLVHVQGRAIGRVPIADAQFQDAVVHDCLKLQSTLEVLQWVPASGLMKDLSGQPRHSLEWSTSYHDSSRFRQPSPQNPRLPTGLHLGTRTTPCSRVKLGAFSLTEATQALNELARSKLPRAVLETLHEMQSLEMEINALLDCKVRRRFWNLHPDVVTFNTAISACAKGSHWLSSLKMFSLLHEQQLQADHVTFNSVLNAFRLTWRSSLDLLAQMGDSETAPDIISYNTCISGCWHWPTAVQLQQLATSNQLRLDIISYASAFDAARSVRSSDGLWWQVLRQLEAMSQDSMLPERVCLRSVINSCEKHCQWQRALDHLASFDDVRLARDFPAWSAAASVYAACGLWRDAFVLLEGIRQNSAGTSCNAVLNACERVSQWQRAIELEATDDNPTVVTFSCVSSALEKAGEWHQALLLLGDMKVALDQWDQWNRLLGAAQCDHLQRNNQCMFQRKPVAARACSCSDYTIFALFMSCCSAAAVCTKSFLPHFVPSKVTPAILCILPESDWVSGLLYQQADCVEYPVQILYSIAFADVLPDEISFNAAITACEKAGQWEFALELLEKMTEFILESTVISPDLMVCQCLKDLPVFAAPDMLVHFHSFESAAHYLPDIVHAAEISFFSCQDGFFYGRPGFRGTVAEAKASIFGQHEVGDLRVRFLCTKNCDATVVAVQCHKELGETETFVPYRLVPRAPCDGEIQERLKIVEAGERSLRDLREGSCCAGGVATCCCCPCNTVACFTSQEVVTEEIFFITDSIEVKERPFRRAVSRSPWRLWNWRLFGWALSYFALRLMLFPFIADSTLAGLSRWGKLAPSLLLLMITLIVWALVVTAAYACYRPSMGIKYFVAVAIIIGIPFLCNQFIQASK